MEKVHKKSIVSELTELFESSLYSESTKITYLCCIRKIIQRGLLSEYDTVEDLAKRDHRDVFLKIMNENAKNATKNVRLASYIAFMRFISSLKGETGVEINLPPVEQDNGRSIYKPTREKVYFQAVTKDQINNIITFLNRNHPEAAAAAFLLYGGVRRISELWAVKWRDVDEEKCEITFKLLKKRGTGEIIKIRYDREPFELYIAFLKKAGDHPNDRILRHASGKNISKDFCRRHLKTAAWKCGIAQTDVSLHTLRSSAITHMSDRGDAPSRIKDVAGHRSIVMVDKYIRSHKYNALQEEPIKIHVTY